MEKKIGRPLKNSDTVYHKKLISFPEPILKMINGNLTAFVVQATLEKLVREQNIK
jgi:hypothetical protein